MRKSMIALEQVGEYVDCPETYFALHAVSRSIYSRMPRVFPITLSTLVNKYKFQIRDPKYSKWLTVVALGEDADAVKFLNEAVKCPGRCLLIDDVLGLVSVSALATVSDSALNSLIEASLTGELDFVNYGALVAACSMTSSFSLSIMKPLRSLAPVTRYLPGLDAGKDASWSVTLAAVAGGSEEVVDFVERWADKPVEHSVPMGTARLWVPESSRRCSLVVTLDTVGGGPKEVDRFMNKVGDEQARSRSLPVCAASAVAGGNLGLVERMCEGAGCVAVFAVPALLIEAIRKGNLEIVKFLFEHGAPVNLPKRGNSVLEWNYLPHNPIAGIAQKREVGPDDLAIIDYLIEQKANIHDAEDEVPARPPRTLLSLAAQYARADVCAHLRNLGVKGSLIDAMEPWDDVVFKPELIDVFTARGFRIGEHVESQMYGYPITAACACGNWAAAKELVARGANVNVRGGMDGHTPLTAVIPRLKWGKDAVKVKIAEWLLSLCPGLAITPTADGMYPLGLADAYSQESKGVYFDLKALLCANGANHEHLVEPDMLCRPHRHGSYTLRPQVESLAELDSQTRRWLDGGLEIDGKTAMMACADRGDVLGVTSLIRLGQPGDGLLVRKVISQALLLDMFDCFDFLLEFTPNVDKTDANGNTILHEVVESRRLREEMIEHLIDREANLYSKNMQGRTALACLCLDAEERWDYIESLAGKGADLNTRDAHGRTPLWIAAMRGHYDLVYLLLDSYADRDIPDSNGIYPLDLMAFHARFAMDVSDLWEPDCVNIPGAGFFRSTDRHWMNPSKMREDCLEELQQRTERRPLVPSCDLTFARDMGFVTIQKLLENPRGPEKPEIHEYASICGYPVIRAARRQQLDQLRELVARGDRLDVSGGRCGLTPLTACIGGWETKGVAGVHSKREVAEYLLEQCPQLATMTDKFGRDALRYIENMQDDARDEIHGEGRREELAFFFVLVDRHRQYTRGEHNKE